MTLAEYLDPKRFPLTTKFGVSHREQILTDAFCHCQLQEARDAGQPLNARQQRELVELEEKARYRAAMLSLLGPGVK